MWKNKRFNRRQVNRRGWLLPFVLLILGATSFSVWAAGPLQIMMLSTEEADVAPEPITAVDVDRIGTDLKLNDSPASSTTIPWRIYFFAVPGGDGTSLFVATGQTLELGTDVNVEVGVGGAPRVIFGMTYNTEETAYETLIGGVFTPGPSTVEGDIALSTDLDDDETLDTGPISFRRSYVPTTGAAPIVSDDNNLEMTLSDDSLAVNAYALVMSSNAVPGPVPVGHQLVGQPYSVRPSGAILTSTKPMLLKLLYTDATLGDVDAHTLSVLLWEPVTREWDDVGGSLDDLIEHSVSTTTDRFTVYALMSVPRWRDGFNDFTGLSGREHVTVLLPHGELVLDGLAYTGTATSRVITPAISIEEWGQVTFTRTVPAGTSLVVDVLSAGDDLLLGNVTSGTSLASIDPVAHPSLRLRATFSTDDLGKSASLDKWAITWQPRSYEVYLPVVLKQ